MIRRSQRFLTQMYIFSDLLCTLFAFLLAYWLKFISGWMVSVEILSIGHYLVWGTVYAFSSVLIGFIIGFYAPKRKLRFSRDVAKVFQVQIYSFVGLLSLLYIAKEVHVSREFLAIFFVTNIAAIILYRYLVKTGLFWVRRKGYNKRFVLIVGAGSTGRSFYQNLLLHPELGYEVIGFLDDYQEEHEVKYRGMKPIIGKADDLESVLNTRLVDEVIIALPLDAHSKYAKLINVSDNAGAKVLIIPDFFDLLPSKPYFDTFAGIPLINTRDIPLDELNSRLIKRAFDIGFSILAIMMMSPIMLIAVIGIKITSRGPVIFKQERMGLNRRLFQMYKFRTMHLSDEETSSTQWTIENDPRRTHFGAFLRRTSIDELPQFFNVLVGHMSVVGPRPERPYFVEQFKDEIPKYMVKHHIRPGITGWAQSNGLRGDTSIQDRIVHDLFYIENWTFYFDLKIILKTIVRGFVNRDAY